MVDVMLIYSRMLAPTSSRSSASSPSSMFDSTNSGMHHFTPISPAKGDSTPISLEKYYFEIVDVDGFRIDKILMKEKEEIVLD